ncbi:MAG: O-antigen ligase family protein [Patescibacteria group bacterium]|nr:O-antigen ligase family protein [Patescibacteria group bacterium]
MFLKISKFFLYLVPFSAAVVYQGTLFPFIVGKYVFFRTVVDLALMFFIWHWAMQKSQISNLKSQKLEESKNILKSIIKNPSVVAVALFTLIFISAGFFGVNPHASFWSNFERGEGVFQIIHLFIFFILLTLTFTNKESWRKMFVVSIWAAILVISYGLAAAIGIGDFVGSSLCARFSGSLGNPAYTGTYLIFAIFYALYLANNEEPKKRKKWMWVGLAILFFIFLLFTQTRGALLGLGVATIFGLFYFFFLSPKGKAGNIALIGAILLIISGALGYNFRREINIMPFCHEESGGNRILDVNFQTETFQTRLLLWKESIEAFKERPILGWGPENFAVAFEKYYQPQFTAWYDRAHNIFFDYLVMTGALGLLSFLAIFGVFYWRFFKFNKQPIPLSSGQAINPAFFGTGNQQQNNKQKSSVVSYKPLVSRALLFALPIAYLTQGLVLFDILSIYINLFLFLSFANYKLTENSRFITNN